MISICIPSFNRPELISRTLKSIYTISEIDYYKFEVIVSDDNSPRVHEIRDVVSSFNKQNLFFFESDVNIGEAQNRSKLFNISSGEYLFFLCDDDELVSDWLASFTTSIQRHHADAYFYGFYSIDESGNVLKKRKPLISHKVGDIYQKLNLLRFQDFPYYHVSPVSVLLKRKCLVSIPLSYNVGIADDLALIVDLFLQNENLNIYFISKYLLKYRKFSLESNEIQSNQSLDVSKQKLGLVLLRDYFVNKYGISLIKIVGEKLVLEIGFDMAFRDMKYSHLEILKASNLSLFLRIKSFKEKNRYLNKLYRLNLYICYYLKVLLKF